MPPSIDQCLAQRSIVQLELVSEKLLQANCCKNSLPDAYNCVQRHPVDVVLRSQCIELATDVTNHIDEGLQC